MVTYPAIDIFCFYNYLLRLLQVYYCLSKKLPIQRKGLKLHLFYKVPQRRDKSGLSFEYVTT